jgi:hypothetical protein
LGISALNINAGGQYNNEKSGRENAKTGRAEKRRAGYSLFVVYSLGAGVTLRAVPALGLAASITSAMKAGCKQPAQMVFEGCERCMKFRLAQYNHVNMGVFESKDEKMVEAKIDCW